MIVPRSSNPPYTLAQQQGIALLTVLLLVVAITVMAGSLTVSQKISLRHYELMATQTQLEHDTQTGIELAKTMLMADAAVNQSDSLLDVWAQPIPPVTLGEAPATRDIGLSIIDASARFNLNNLYHDGGTDELAIETFKQLLIQLDLEPNLAYALLDWQDPDDIPSPEGGAEALAYATQATSDASGIGVDIGNQPLLFVDELASVKGFDANAVETLRPYVTAVPYYLPVNLNTASSEVVLAVINGAITKANEDAKNAQQNEQNNTSGSDTFDDQSSGAAINTSLIDAAVVQPLIEKLQTTPAPTLDDAMTQPVFVSLPQNVNDVLTTMIDVSSQAFELRMDIKITQPFVSTPRYRYVTAYIGKRLPSTQSDTDDTSTQSDSATNQPPQIDAFAIRRWAYPPTQ